MKPGKRPDWLDETPNSNTGLVPTLQRQRARLLLFDGTGRTLQQIVITREEYILLKDCLAKLRGFVKEPKAE